MDFSLALSGVIVTLRTAFSSSFSVSSAGSMVNPVTARETTVTIQTAVIPLSSDVALMEAVPGAMAVTIPSCETSATDESEEDHTTFLSSALAVAISFCVSDSARVRASLSRIRRSTCTGSFSQAQIKAARQNTIIALKLLFMLSSFNYL